MLITRGLGFNSGSGGTGETVYVYAPDPSVTTTSFGEMHMSSDISLPYLNVNSNLELKPIISSNNEETSIIIDILKPSLHIQEE